MTWKGLGCAHLLVLNNRAPTTADRGFAIQWDRKGKYQPDPFRPFIMNSQCLGTLQFNWSFTFLERRVLDLQVPTLLDQTWLFVSQSAHMCRVELCTSPVGMSLNKLLSVLCVENNEQTFSWAQCQTAMRIVLFVTFLHILFLTFHWRQVNLYLQWNLYSWALLKQTIFVILLGMCTYIVAMGCLLKTSLKTISK